VLVKRKTIRLDGFEEDVVINSLNKVRTEQLKNNECDRDVSDIMLKIMKSKTRKARRRDEAR
jgi:hypothetical protein